MMGAFETNTNWCKYEHRTITKHGLVFTLNCTLLLNIFNQNCHFEEHIKYITYILNIWELGIILLNMLNV